VLTSAFDYDLPEQCIALHPPEARDGARMLIVDGQELTDDWVRNFSEFVDPGSLVVVNDSRVRRARVFARRRRTGGRVELLLIERKPNSATSKTELWRALGRPARLLRATEWFDSDGLTMRVVERDAEGLFLVEVQSSDGDVESILESRGHVPIPPYLHRADDVNDVERYQTVYARGVGSVAAPTAGLHLTERAIGRLRERNIDVGAVTLHVGIGTFRPVTAEDLDQHPMHSERFEVSDELAERVRTTRRRGGRVVAIGTTAVRALESAASSAEPGLVEAMASDTRLLIQPGYQFKVVDSLLTNFHQPRSTLLALVAAAVGIETLRHSYRTAVERGYRFLSYGDAMWIPEIERC
jgi:S-adenosylmethionine:tRNA ribosyltransferase-isomerase